MKQKKRNNNSQKQREIEISKDTNYGDQISDSSTEWESNSKNIETENDKIYF